MGSRGARPSLTHALDKEVYQVVRKLADEQEQENGAKRLTTSTIYDSIKRSNSGLKRRPKKLLEDSIERVLNVIKEELDDSDSMDGDFEGIEEPGPQLKEHNVMNKSITRMWAKSNSTNVTPAREGTPPVNGTLTPNLPIQSLPLAEIESPAKPERQANGEPSKKRRKADTSKDVDRSPPTDVSLKGLGGVGPVVRQLSRLVAFPMLNPKRYMKTGIQPTKGVLLHGPPGCGKTMIATALAAHVGVSFIPISAPSLVAGTSGESEKKIRDLFEEAKRMAPCLVFIDEIDVIMGKRESAQREMEKRMVAQMLTCMDDMALDKTGGKPVIILAATNRPDSLDPALRRAGRFNKEINLGVPNEKAREKILRALTQKLTMPEDFDYRRLAKLTPGFVGADLNDVVSEAGTDAMQRMIAVATKQTVTAMDIDTTSIDDEDDFAVLELDSIVANGEGDSDDEFSITYDDFLTAIPRVQPSAKREGFATIPDTTWAHVGALHEVREQLEAAIVDPIQDPELFAEYGLTLPSGVLLWGPPGCGKTLLAKAVANESKANFISIKGPELLNKYVGESERAVRQVFERARSSVPCILFFDELDALVPKREDSLSEASSRVVNTLLTELDGLGSRAGIYVIAATNRPDMIDQAMLRPGRLGLSVFVDLPTKADRVEILKALYVKALPGSPEEELAALKEVAEDDRCTDFSGADLWSLQQEVGRAAIQRRKRERKEGVETVGLRIRKGDWDVALGKVQPSVKKEDVAKYRILKERGMQVRKS
ncbi:hypothetical protein VTL71DRAFT_10667 [Oculimacula yallundae]|uniref:AAA+ ATPase domain-containing protein n=1 Tax=Oculimacula yallundae TaxID=86028 RepID=A0ABR4CVF0_9HELO